MRYDLVVIGGGPGGLAAAIEARNNGVENILVIERDKELGGILQQCIHNGFGLHEFKEELTGPEYAERFIKKLKEKNIEYKLDTMGCRERTRGAISIPGERPAGVFTAGTAQRFINMEGYMVGKKVLILGSGDIGLIMARRMTLEGAEVQAVVELMPFSGGLARNIAQCLNDYNIPLYLSHTVVDIKGKERVEGVTIAKVDENRRPIPGTEIEYECDTLLLSVGLIPENDISRKTGIVIDRRTSGPVVNEMMETSIPGIFACGNVVHVHDLVDFVSAEARKAGKAAAKFVKDEVQNGEYIELKNGFGVTYTVPQKYRVENIENFLEISMRVNNIYKNMRLQVKDGDTVLVNMKKAHLAPGEMEKVVVPKKLLESVKGNELVVCLVPEEEK